MRTVWADEYGFHRGYEHDNLQVVEFGDRDCGRGLDVADVVRSCIAVDCEDVDGDAGAHEAGEAYGANSGTDNGWVIAGG